MIPARFSRPRTLAGRAGAAIERVLEQPRDRTVVFRGNEEETVRGPDLAFHPYDHQRVLVVVLVIQRKVADLHLAEGKFRRRKLSRWHRQVSG